MKRGRPHTRIQQLLTGVVAVLSLAVSSIAACTCSHHQTAPGPTKSCHGTAHHQPKSKTVAHGSPNLGQNCDCIQPTSELSVKSEPFKLKKQLPVFTANAAITQVEFKLASSDGIPETDTLFYSSLPLGVVHSRGPPVL